MIENFHLKIVLILCFGFTCASFFGYLTYKAKLSPLLGYLLAGYFIGPYSPGFVADLKLSEELAEIGIVLMMFGVGLQFKWQELIKTCSISIPGALGQTFVTTLIGAALIISIGWTWQAGIIFGLAIGVASTVVLIRVLSDNDLLKTVQGHISVGWLIVEDIITMAVLLVIPPLSDALKGSEFSSMAIFLSFIIDLIKFLLFAALMLTIGRKVIAALISKVLLTESSELFTLTILALTFAIAVGSTLLFGTSLALGAFIAGLAIGQTDLRLRVSKNILPLKDSFVVIFFISVGMLFNPSAIVLHFWFFLAVLAIVLIVKPIIALLITLIFKYPLKTAIIVAMALAQIGEFSFILAEEAMKFNILPDDGYDIIVACSIVSISINPLLFKLYRNYNREADEI